VVERVMVMVTSPVMVMSAMDLFGEASRCVNLQSVHRRRLCGVGRGAKRDDSGDCGEKQRAFHKSSLGVQR
jgi:hypothetical protein